MPSAGTIIAQHKKAAFLAAYRQCGNITHACEAASVTRRLYYIWTEHDETFAHNARQALTEAGERLEIEARRRAVEGVRREKPVYYKDQLLATVIETDYSDTLLIFMLKAAMPEKYREKWDGSSDQRPIHITFGPVSATGPAQLPAEAT